MSETKPHFISEQWIRQSHGQLQAGFQNPENSPTPRKSQRSVAQFKPWTHQHEYMSNDLAKNLLSGVA